MARAKAAKQEPLEPEAESLDIADSDGDEADEGDSPGHNGPARGKTISKADAARAAIRQGIESPQEASAYIMQQFGIDMAPQHFSAVKSQLRKKEREAESAGQPSAPGRRGRRSTIENYLSSPPRQPSSGVEADLLDAMEAIKPLVAHLGADKVKRIVELLG